MVRNFYKFRAVAALGPAIAVIVALAAAPAAEMPRPVAVIDRTDIEMSGLTNVGELLLSRSIYNDFGLHRPFVLGTGRAAVPHQRAPRIGLDLRSRHPPGLGRRERRDPGRGRHTCLP